MKTYDPAESPMRPQGCTRVAQVRDEIAQLEREETELSALHDGIHPRIEQEGFDVFASRRVLAVLERWLADELHAVRGRLDELGVQPSPLLSRPA
jgi:uncharacterized protein (UPF0335 family)